MNIEIPGGLLIIMTLLNIVMLLVVVAGFINPKMVYQELKRRVLKIRME